VKEDEMDRVCSIHGEEEECIEILVGKSEGKLPLERHRRRWLDNIKMYLRQDWVVWSRFIWCRIGTNGGELLLTW
jgi:hypothetical protein